MTFWNRQDCKDRKQISGGQGLGVGETQRSLGVESLCEALAGEHGMLCVCQTSYSLSA